MNTFLLRDVVNADSSASISDYGAHVLTWTPAGQPPVIWRPAAVQLCEGTAIRGGVPIIFPWFNTGWDGGRPVSKQPKHGFGRVAFWSFDADASSDRHVRYTLDSADFGDDLLAQLNSGDHPRFRATYDVEIGERIAMALTVANGFGRVAFWSFDADASSDRHVRYTLDSADFGDDLLAQLNSGDHPRFRATYDVEIGERIAMALTVANDGDEPLTYEAALHTYLHVGDVERIAVHGLESCEYLDNTQPGVPHCSATGEPITFDGMVDRSRSTAWSTGRICAGMKPTLPSPSTTRCWGAQSRSSMPAHRRRWSGIRARPPATRWAIWPSANGAASSAWRRWPVSTGA